MATVGFAQERKDSPEGEFDVGRFVLTRRFRVETTDLNDGPLVVTAAPGIPLMYSTYATPNEAHPYVRAKSFTAARVAPGSYFWIVTVRYETPAATSGGGADNSVSGGAAGGGLPQETDGEHDDPLLELPDLETDGENIQEPIEKIYNVTTEAIEPLKNTAGEVFNPPPLKDSGRLMMTITRNEPLTAPHPYLNVYYQNAVNRDTFWGSPAGTAKIMTIKAKRQLKILTSGLVVGYLRVTYVIHFRPDWDTFLLNKGTYYWDSLDRTNKPKRQFVTAEGHPTTGLLDANGLKLAEGATELYVQVRPYPRLPFAPLNLPQTWAEVK